MSSLILLFLILTIHYSFSDDAPLLNGIQAVNNARKKATEELFHTTQENESFALYNLAKIALMQNLPEEAQSLLEKIKKPESTLGYPVAWNYTVSLLMVAEQLIWNLPETTIEACEKAIQKSYKAARITKSLSSNSSNLLTAYLFERVLFLYDQLATVKVTPFSTRKSCVFFINEAITKFQKLSVDLTQTLTIKESLFLSEYQTYLLEKEKKTIENYPMAIEFAWNTLSTDFDKTKGVLLGELVKTNQRLLAQSSSYQEKIAALENMQFLGSVATVSSTDKIMECIFESYLKYGKESFQIVANLLEKLKEDLEKAAQSDLPKELLFSNEISLFFTQFLEQEWSALASLSFKQQKEKISAIISLLRDMHTSPEALLYRITIDFIKTKTLPEALLNPILFLLDGYHTIKKKNGLPYEQYKQTEALLEKNKEQLLSTKTTADEEETLQILFASYSILNHDSLISLLAEGLETAIEKNTSAIAFIFHELENYTKEAPKYLPTVNTFAQALKIYQDNPEEIFLDQMLIPMATLLKEAASEEPNQSIEASLNVSSQEIAALEKRLEKTDQIPESMTEMSALLLPLQQKLFTKIKAIKISENFIKTKITDLVEKASRICSALQTLWKQDPIDYRENILSGQKALELIGQEIKTAFQAKELQQEFSTLSSQQTETTGTEMIPSLKEKNSIERLLSLEQEDKKKQQQFIVPSNSESKPW